MSNPKKRDQDYVRYLHAENARLRAVLAAVAQTILSALGSEDRDG